MFVTVEDAFFTGILRENTNIQLIDWWNQFGKEHDLFFKTNQNCDFYGVPHLTSFYLHGEKNYTEWLDKLKN